MKLKSIDQATEQLFMKKILSLLRFLDSYLWQLDKFFLFILALKYIYKFLKNHESL